MGVILGVLAGLAWGALIAFLNSLITKNALKAEGGSALLTANLLRNVLDIAALAVIFLLRKVLPFSYTATLIAAAVSLSMLTILFMYKIARTK